jgi:hypothetical protein
MRSKVIFWVTTLILTLAVAACGGDPDSVYQVVTPASISPGSPIPAPTEEVILTISGDVSVTNVGDTLQLDMPTLEHLGLVQYTVSDPHLLTDVTYTGVLMSKLSEFVGASKSASNIHIVALDDYHVDLSFEYIKKWPILLATRSNGEYMDVDSSGPTRIVFPYDSYSELDPVRYDHLWIWNIESMEVN